MSVHNTDDSIDRQIFSVTCTMYMDSNNNGFNGVSINTYQDRLNGCKTAIESILKAKK